MKKSKIRQSNFELLRIITMFLIIAHHFSVHGHFNFENTGFINKYWILFLESWGKIGVNIFVLISGYFLVSSKNSSTEKVLKLLIQIIFYSVVLYLVFSWFNIIDFNLRSFLDYILGYPNWWFFTSYLVLYLFHPYINMVLNQFDQKSFKKFLILSTIVFSIIPTITRFPFDNGMIAWFIYVYSLGAYFKKYPLSNNKNKYLLLSILCYSLTFLSVIVLNHMGKYSLFIASNTMYFFCVDKVTTLLISIFIFIYFSKLNIKENKVINIISSTTFGIYLIHDCSFVRDYLWLDLFKNAEYINSPYLILYSLMVISIVFICCSLIELFRLYIIQPLYLKALSKFSNKIDNYIDHI